MERAIKEKTEEIREQAPIARQLPRITLQVHTPITSMSRGAEHLRMRPESAFPSAAQADFSNRVVRNVQDIMPEGTPSLASRFLRMLG